MLLVGTWKQLGVAHAPMFFVLRMKKVKEQRFLQESKILMSSYFRSRARKGPGTEEQESLVAGPVCDRSSPGQDRKRLEHAGRIRIFRACSFILQYCRFHNCIKRYRNWIKVEITNTNRFTICPAEFKQRQITTGVINICARSGIFVMKNHGVIYIWTRAGYLI
jgi:hypothetical protein